MAKRKFEWKEGWTEVKERRKPPSACSSGNYKRGVISKKKDISGVFCCPRGTKLKKGKRGCYRGNKKVGTIELQALRHGVPKFKKNHPRIWKKLQKTKPNKQGVRAVTAHVK